MIHIRAGNAGRNNRRNCHENNQIGFNKVHRTWLIMTFVLRGYLIYLFLANLCLSTTHVGVTKLDIKSFYVNYNIVNSTTIKLDNNATLQTILQTNCYFTLFLELGIFNLSIVSKNYPVSTFALVNSRFWETKNNLALKFKPRETQLPHEKVMHP